MNLSLKNLDDCMYKCATTQKKGVDGCSNIISDEQKGVCWRMLKQDI